MSRTRIPAALREQVRQRAHRVCEYCLLHEDDGVHGFHVDHVISEKHGGPTEEHNLAFCCPFCNRAKGSDVAGIEGGVTVRLFNPRIDHWAEHFQIESERIGARSNVAAVTCAITRAGGNFCFSSSLLQAPVLMRWWCGPQGAATISLLPPP